MSRPKSGKPGGRDEPIEDPQLLKDALRLLFEAETEFPIKVEGTSTLPYTSRVQAFDQEKREFLLKLVRPLPHELMGGALFRMVFAVEEQRYEALITYIGREGYLQYRFSQPEHLFYADRRRFKRFPFRPRESAYVIASDGGVPGLGVAGPLVNIGLGGLALRVDRVLQLDDGVRIPPNTALFDHGASFPRIRLQDIPRLPMLELDGRVAHAYERGAEIILGFDFGELSEDHARALGDCLAFREKLFQSRLGMARAEGASGSAGTPASAVPGAPPAEDRDRPEGTPGWIQGLSSDPLLLLRRKATRLVLITVEKNQADRFRKALWNHGYQRLDLAEDFDGARALWQQTGGRAKPRLLMVDLALARVGDAEPLAAVRYLEHQAKALGEIQTAILCEDIDPTMLLGQSEGTRFLPYGDENESRWVEALDTLLGIRIEEE